MKVFIFKLFVCFAPANVDLASDIIGVVFFKAFLSSSIPDFKHFNVSLFVNLLGIAIPNVVIVEYLT